MKPTIYEALDVIKDHLSNPKQIISLNEKELNRIVDFLKKNKSTSGHHDGSIVISSTPTHIGDVIRVYSHHDYFFGANTEHLDVSDYESW